MKSAKAVIIGIIVGLTTTIVLTACVMKRDTQKTQELHSKAQTTSTANSTLTDTLKQEEPPKNIGKFVRVYYEQERADGLMIYVSIYVDSVTGVEYIYTHNGGFTPRLNKDGTPKIFKQEEYK